MYSKLHKTIQKFVLEENLIYLRGEEKLYFTEGHILIVLPIEHSTLLKIEKNSHLSNGKEFSIDDIQYLLGLQFKPCYKIKVNNLLDFNSFLVKYLNYRLPTKKELKVFATLFEILMKELFFDKLIEISILSNQKGIIRLRKNQNGTEVYLALHTIDCQVEEIKEVEDEQKN